LSQENGSVPNFSWKDCGEKSYPIHVNNITLMPEELKLPGNITFGFNAQLDKNVTAPLKVYSLLQCFNYFRYHLFVVYYF